MKQLNLEKKLFQLILKIPKGKVVSYKTLALKLKVHPRRIGYFLSLNRDLLKIPCHRVVKSNGELGGYRLGLKLKIYFLKKEGIKIRNKKVLKKFFVEI